MRNTVTRLKPRSADYKFAVRALLDGDFAYCVEALDSNPLLPAVALRTRALGRLGLFSEVVSAVDALDLSEVRHEYAGEFLALKAGALLAMRDPGTQAAITEARVRAYSSGFTPLECEVEHTAAMAEWTSGHAAEALLGVERVLNVSVQPPYFGGFERDDYIYSPGFWRSRAYNLRGLVEATKEDYFAQAASLVEAFKEFDRAGLADTFAEARMLNNLADLVRDIDSKALVAYVEDRAERVAWNRNTVDQEFGVFQAIGWNHARRGDHLGALRHLRHSATCAPTVPLQIMAVLDRSFLAGELGEVFTAREELEHAVKLSKLVDWEKSAGTERNALFALARQIAPIDKVQARALWDRYSTLKTAISTHALAARGDRRIRADECSAHASVLIAEGQRGRAITLLLESLSIWSEVGYSWRAGAVAMELSELTGEVKYFDLAAREAEKQPNSWLGRRVAALRGLALA